MPHEMLEGREDYYHVDPSKELKNHAWRIRYGDGSYAKGKVYMDKVVVGGVTATTQAVEAATLVSTQFEQDELTDGLLGLAFSHLNSVEPNPQKTFFDNVMADLQEPVFAVNLKNRAPGSYDFGFVDEGKYTGDIAYIDVNSTDGFWTIYPEGYAVGGSSTVLRTFETITDTGTTLTFVPTEVAKAYYAQVKGSWYSGDQAGWIAPCNAALPDFSLVISGVKRTMPGKYARFAPLEDGSSNCFGGIQGAGGNIPSILGDTFLKSQYVIHEIRDGKARMGFAQQAGLQNVMGT
jgi:aspergillopepsin I